MEIIGVIPARYGSSRLPGKPLLTIQGKPMVWWVYQRAKKAAGLSRIYVATDHREIEKACQDLEIPVLMTSPKHRCGANRLWEVSQKIPGDFYIQINGDEPLILPENIESAIPNPGLCRRMAREEYGTNIITEVLHPAETLDSSNIKVVFDGEGKALYMSRTPIPYPAASLEVCYYKHVGIIGYSKKMLDFYQNSQPGFLERTEGIDTLRFLDYGKPLFLIPVKKANTLSVDTVKDLEEVRKRVENAELC